MKKWVFLSLLLPLSLWSIQSLVQDEGLIVNEVSTGPSGNGEYVELLLVGCPDEGDVTTIDGNTVDLGNWILDDADVNTATTGAQQGHIRFKDVAFWDAVPVGAIIVIYDPNGTNPKITDDFNIDGDQVLVLPTNATDPSTTDALFEVNTTSEAYNVATTYTDANATSWNIVMDFDNVGDAVQTRDPAALGVIFHGIDWGTSLLGNVVSTTGNMDVNGEVIYFNTFRFVLLKGFHSFQV